jgi:primosomal protein N'
VLRALFPVPDPSSSREVPVTFWTYTPHGPMPAPRTISVPEWDEISSNYAAETRRQLDTVMREFRPSHGGQLVLWHGTPGTGKTFALRALAWEWREWCQLHYIVDPDSFFGQHADYLMNVLMQPGMPMMALGGGMVGPSSAFIVGQMDGNEDEEVADQAWRLLVLEDTGELLTPDAKSVIGQGLSRFLNVVDGLIGQGLRVLVLVTTNEEIKSLHPAVARPGRAAANVNFAPLSRSEASEWLRERGIEQSSESRTIASLYAQLDGRDPGEAVSSVGFGESG